MKSKILTLISAVFLLIIAGTLLSCDNNDVRTADNYEVKVVLRAHDGLTINSEAVLNVKAGSSAEFEVEISDDYIYLGNNANADYN